MILPFINDEPTASGLFKQQLSDFIVHEQLSFEPSGSGEHVFLHIEKTALNTIQVAEQLAKFAKIKLRDIGYAGLKDRLGITTQWFSLYLPKNPVINWHDFNSEFIKVLTVTKHDRKLRTGALKGNSFEITLRQVNGADSICERLEGLKITGFPNYFGEQRFGRHEGNIEKAFAMLNNELEVKNNKLRGIYYSTARSFIFNNILAERVRQKNFNKAVAGDMLQFLGRRGYFSIDAVDGLIQERIAKREVTPAGPLWGIGEHHVSLDAKLTEEQVLANHPRWLQALEEHKLELAYRPYVAYPENVDSQLKANSTLTLKFSLLRGCYATSLLRELLTLII